MRKTVLLIYFIFQVLLSQVNAQNSYPIYVTPTLTPPYSLNLSDYSKFGSQQLMVTVHVNDLNVSNLPVKLRIKMETMGVTIENPPTINTIPIYVDGGTTSILFGRDLTDYFNVNNLIFKGYSKEAYNRTGQLPEGFYRFTVEVLHFNSNRVISNQGTTSAWIALGKPPVLKLPEEDAQMGQFKGMPLTFSWLASNVGSPVSANSIQYTFEMWEMRVDGINPNTVVASMPVFHEHTTFNTLYSLYPVTLLMEPGMRYAWRVTASDVSGFVPFEQNGHSEVRTFVYKSACDSVTDLESRHRAQSGLFSWEPKENHTSFNVEMRNPETGWIMNSQSYENKAEFFDLEYGSTYEMRVQAVCDGDPNSTSDFSDWKTLSIPVPKPLTDSANCPDCACDDDMPGSQLDEYVLREDLKVGDTIINRTGTTRFILKTVEPQGGGTYKGIFLFWAEIWNLKFICEYWDLQVNEEDIIVNMDFESVYDPQFLIDIDATIDYLNNLADAINTLTPDAQIKDTITFNETINSIYVNAGDSVIAVTVDENGNIHEVVLSDDADNIEKTLIKGENGEEYVVNKNGDVMGVDEYINTNGGNDKKVEDYNKKKEEENLSSTTTVEFSASENQKYGFDTYSDERSLIENEYPALSNGYRPAYKSVASYSTDIVGVSNSGNNIIFKDEMGIPALMTGENLTLRGSTDGSEVALYAYKAVNDSTEEIVGKLNIHSFDEQALTLYIVSVNGATIPNSSDLEATLNKIYSQAITKWEVKSIEGFTGVTYEGENMVHGGTSAISVYNKDQRTVVNTFENDFTKLEKNAYYLFFVENVQFKERSIAGYMPLQRQVGFIYDNPGLNIVAHELGHGAFNMYHTFSDKKFIANEHSTQNLMDYTGGIDLWKHQWQNVQSPDRMFFAFLQDEKEGEFEPYEFLVGKNVIPGEIKNVISTGSGYVSFITRAGKIISIPGNAKDVTFSNFGTLFAFTIDKDGGQERYVSATYRKGEHAGKFGGFVNALKKTNNDDFERYEDYHSKTLTGTNTTAYLGIINFSASNDDGCGIDIFSCEYPISDISGNYNTGGNTLPVTGSETIKSKISSTYEVDSETKFGNKVKYLITTDSPQACNTCPRGKTFFNTYSELTENENDIACLTRIVELICQLEDIENIDLTILQEQLHKDFNDKLDNVFWNSDKALYRAARDKFWEQSNAWELYYEALSQVAKNIENFNNELKANASKEDFYAALFYLNDGFLSSLSINQRISILKTLFEHNLFITESLFNHKMSDVTLIKKVVQTVDNEDINTFISDIASVKHQFKNSSDNQIYRDVLFEIVYAMSTEQVSSISLENKFKILHTFLDKNLRNLFGRNHDAMVAKVIRSVKNEEAATFFDGMLSADYADNDGNPLIYRLKENLGDFLNHDDPYTEFFMEIKRLSDAKYIQDGAYKVDAEIIWDVEQKDYVIFSFVRNRNDFDYVYNKENHSVHIETCTEYDYHYTPGTGTSGGTYTKTCNEYVYPLPKESSPFEPVAITFLHDISPFTKGCYNEQGEQGFCGEAIILPAIFLEYLEESVSLQRWKNFGWNTFNVVVTVATFGEGAAAITAIRTAAAGTRTVVVIKNLYTLIDFGYTVTTMTGQAFGHKWSDEWNYVGYLFAAKTATDLLAKGGHKGVAYVRNIADEADKARIIDELGIVNKNGTKITEAEFDEFINKVDNQLKNSDSPEVREEYQKALAQYGTNSPRKITDDILARINNPSSDFDNYLKSLENTSVETLQSLDNLGSDITKFYDDFTELNKVVNLNDADIISAYGVLKNAPTFRVKKENLELLKKVHNRFAYNGKESFYGLNDLFAGGASKQKLLDGLGKADELFPQSLNVKFSGIKAGEIKVLDPNGDELARIVDGSLVRKKFLENGSSAGSVDGHEILKNGDEIGFKKSLQSGNNLLDETYNTQKEIINKYKGETIKNANSNAKGVFGEIASDIKFTENGYQSLHLRKETLLDAWGINGIDHVYVKNGKYYIVESKYGSSNLNANTADGAQMSDSWITGSNRLRNAVGENHASEILDSGYTRVLSNVAEDGTITLYEIDNLGNKLGDFNL